MNPSDAAVSGGRHGCRNLAASREDAAAMLGVSVDFFDEHIRPRLRIVYSGRRILVPVAELERWLGTNAASTTRRRAA